MSNLSQVQVGSTTYDLRDYHKTGVYFVRGTHATDTNDWEGTLSGVPVLYDGLTIAYYLHRMGEGNVTLNLTLTDNNNTATGKINCYVGETRLAGQYIPGMVIYLTYLASSNRWAAAADAAGSGDGGMVQYIVSTEQVGSATKGTDIPADDITAWTTNSPTQVTAKTVVTGGSTTTITPVTSKTVVTSASGATAGISYGVLTITNGSFSTGASVTTGTAINAYTTLNTGDSVVVTPGTAASLSYTAKSIPNIISVDPVTVVTDLTPTGVNVPTVRQNPETKGLEIS